MIYANSLCTSINVAKSVNEVGADSQTVADIRKKWSDIKVNVKKRSLPTGEAWVRRAAEAESGSSPYLSCERGSAPFWRGPTSIHPASMLLYYFYLDAC